MSYKKNLIKTFESLPPEESRIMIQKGKYGICAVCKADANNGINISYDKIIPVCDDCLSKLRNDLKYYLEEKQNCDDNSVEITSYNRSSGSDYCDICSMGNHKEYLVKIGIHSFACCKRCLKNFVKKLANYIGKVDFKHDYASVDKKVQSCKNRHYLMLSDARRKYILAGGNSKNTEKSNYLATLSESVFTEYDLQVKQPINCSETKFKEITSKREYAYADKLASLKITPAMKYVECKFGAHTKPTQAQYMMSVAEKDGTSRYMFSFCEECIDNFSYVLRFVRRHSETSYIKENISVIKSVFHNNQHCLFCGKTRGNKSIFIIGSAQFDICDECRELLEINLYLQKNYFLKKKEAEIKKAEEVKKKNTIQKREIEVLEKSNALVEAQQNYLNERKEFVHNFIKSNSAPDYSDRTLKCIMNKKELRNIGYPIKMAKWNPVENLNIVYRFMKQNCNCIKHSVNHRAVAIIETGRKKDSFCFALCKECIKQILNGMVYCRNKASYYNDEYGIYIYQSKWSESEHCIFCGNSDGWEYVFRFNSIQFFLCENCFKMFMKTLKNIYDDC